MSVRLLHALESGALSLPPGRLAVIGPRAGMELPPAGPEHELQLLTSWRPDHDWFSARGFDCRRTPAGAFTAALVLVPRSREAAQGRIALAASLVPDGLLLVEGARTDGIDGLWRALRERLPGAQSLSKAHGRLVWAQAPGAALLAGWLEALEPRRQGGGGRSPVPSRPTAPTPVRPRWPRRFRPCLRARRRRLWAAWPIWGRAGATCRRGCWRLPRR